MGLPYVTSPGNIDKALKGIKTAAVPERVSQDFVKTMLGIPGGSGDQITSFLKKLGFANIDGSPSELYKRFRNPTSSNVAIATAIKQAYRPLYLRNEFMHRLSDDQLLGLVTEETGDAHDSSSVKLTVSCIKHLKSFADFDAPEEIIVSQVPVQRESSVDNARKPAQEVKSFGLNLGYTINLNLPATSDPEVFNAIFKSLKEHLLRDVDA